jgi:hypothetical protein
LDRWVGWIELIGSDWWRKYWTGPHLAHKCQLGLGGLTPKIKARTLSTNVCLHRRSGRILSPHQESSSHPLQGYVFDGGRIGRMGSPGKCSNKTAIENWRCVCQVMSSVARVGGFPSPAKTDGRSILQPWRQGRRIPKSGKNRWKINPPTLAPGSEDSQVPQTPMEDQSSQRKQFKHV